MVASSSTFRGRSWGGQRGKGDWGFKIEVNPPIHQLAAAYAAVGIDVGDFKPAWSRLAPRLAAEIRHILDSNGSAMGPGVPWPPLDPKYLNRRRNEGFGSTPLLRTGRLRGQITSATNGIQKFDKKRLSFGAELRYARAVFFGFKSAARVGGTKVNKSGLTGGDRYVGAKYVQGNTRRRRYLGWNYANKAAATEEVNRHLEDCAKRWAAEAGGKP
jgi:hypothetical protein